MFSHSCPLFWMIDCTCRLQISYFLFFKAQTAYNSFLKMKTYVRVNKNVLFYYFSTVEGWQIQKYLQRFLDYSLKVKQ